RWRIRLAACDAQADEVLGRLELRRVADQIRVLEVWFVERLAGQRLPGLGALLPQTLPRLSVAVPAEVRVEVLASVDLRLELAFGSERAEVETAGVREDLQQEVAADETEDGEEHRRARDDLAVEVRGDLERVRSCGDRGDPIRRRLLDGVAGRVVLLQELDAVCRLLLRLDLLLVVDEVAEVRDEDEEQDEARPREEDVGIHQVSVTSTWSVCHSLSSRRITRSGFVLTTIAPFTSSTWKRSRPRGAGPPFFSAVSLSYSEPWHG